MLHREQPAKICGILGQAESGHHMFPGWAPGHLNVPTGEAGQDVAFSPPGVERTPLMLEAIQQSGSRPGPVCTSATPLYRAPLSLTATHEPGGIVIVAAAGDLDRQNAGNLRAYARRLLSACPTRMVICLEQLRRVDSRGLAALVAVQRVATARDVELRLTAATTTDLARQLRAAEGEQNFKVYPSLAEALV